MPYIVEILRTAVRSLEHIQQADRKRIAAKIDTLADDPRPPGVKKLEAADDLYRVRVGDFRVIYRIDDARKTITVAVIRRRADAYRSR